MPASLAVAEAPGESYNPLFLYGGVGLGKTHLLHAIGHQGVDTGLAVLYVSSEQFTNEIVNAIRYRTQDEFRAKYRSVDILLVDDIQFIAGKESTEEEFFNTFNSLYEMSKQIVICSDRPPKAILSLEERLRSRFEWGLIADIQPPDLETRMAILRVKADLLHYHVPDDIIAYIAGRVQTNIRELEGCLNRLMAFQKLHRAELTMDIARAAISVLSTDTHEPTLNSQQIAKVVADYYHISLEAMCGKQRDKYIVTPRQIAMYLIAMKRPLRCWRSVRCLVDAIIVRFYTLAKRSIGRFSLIKHFVAKSLLFVSNCRANNTNNTNNSHTRETSLRYANHSTTYPGFNYVPH